MYYRSHRKTGELHPRRHQCQDHQPRRHARKLRHQKDGLPDLRGKGRQQAGKGTATRRQDPDRAGIFRDDCLLSMTEQKP